MLTAYWEMAIKKGILCNTWRRTAYDWFPDGLANGGNESNDDDGNDDDEYDDDW